MRYKIVFTEKEQRYIQKNYLKISSNKIGARLGCDGGVVRRYLKANGLVVPKEVSVRFRSESLKGRTTFTKEQSLFIKNYYLQMPVKAMAKKLGKSGTGVKGRMKQLGLVVPKGIIEQRKKDSRFYKGQKAYNKGKKQKDFMNPEAIEKTKATRFQKGQLPHNTNYNGHERISKDGYIEIRIKKGKYRLKHIHEWEKVNGNLPKGYCLRCKDENKLNTKPENWELMTRAENLQLNTIHHLTPTLKKTIILKNRLVKAIEEYEQHY